jgi:hypothetical protein
MTPVRYELCVCIPEDSILCSQSRESLKSYIFSSWFRRYATSRKVVDASPYESVILPVATWF